MGKIARRKIVDLDDFKKGRAEAERLEATIVSDLELSGFDPLHGVYVYGQNKMQDLIQQLTELPVCAKLTAALGKADDDYMPSYPPMSPLTTSYFSCWSMFDLGVGVGRESFAMIALHVSRAFSAHPNLLAIYRAMLESRMGLYLHEGAEGRWTLLKELTTGKKIRCVVPSGYSGTAGEIWFARVLDDPFPNKPYAYSVVFTTPYVAGRYDGHYFCNTGTLADWQAFLDRTLGRTDKDRLQAYEKLMKYGPSRNYWNEYIFQGYANFTDHAVFLAGIPDMPETLPHAPENV